MLMWFAASAWPSYVELPRWVLHAAYGLAMLGAVTCLAGVMAFKKAKTTVNPVTLNAASSMVTTGVYRLSRNPMYVGFALVLVAWSVCLASLIAALFLPLFIAYLCRFQIQPEERAMRAKFGLHYIEYAEQVRRWL